MKILVLNVATNKYIDFLPPLYESMKQNFLVEHDVSYLLFTDRDASHLERDYNLKSSSIVHKPFPEPTLKRYNYFMQEREYIETFDYVFYIDVDMRIVAPVGDEIFGDLCLTQHIQMLNPKPTWTYERNPESTAYIRPDEGTHYFAGGFNGGKAKAFMKMAEVISENVIKDEEKDIVAVWHDESHTNRYAIDNPPSKILPLSYCCPDWKDTLDFSVIQPKIIALNKNHTEVRSD